MVWKNVSEVILVSVLLPLARMTSYDSRGIPSIA